MKNNEFEAVICIVNAGFSDSVMYAARKVGAEGATILKGRGSSGKGAEETFGIAVKPDKEVVIILVPAGIKDDVMRAVYSFAGLDSESQGIIFSMPVARAIGLSGFEEKEEPKE